MKKALLILVIISFVVLTGFQMSIAQEDVGNTVCPVSGEKIEESKKATYEYKGKIYNFCCPMCISDFKKNPEKYIEKMEQSAGSEHSMSMEEGHQHEH